MSDYETLRKQYIEASEESTAAHRKYNEITKDFYSAYINSDRVKNTIGKCFRDKKTKEIFRVIEPSFFKSGRNLNSFAENEYMCLVIEPTLDFIPEDFEKYNPINLDKIYITKHSNLEEITLEEFMEEYKFILNSFDKFIEGEIDTYKNNPVPKTIFRF